MANNKNSKSSEFGAPSNGMKIAIFSLAYIPFVGGAELAVKEVTDRLPHGFFACFTYKFDKNWLAREKIGNVDVIRLPNTGVSGIRKIPETPDINRYYGRFWQKVFYVFKAWRAAEIEHKNNPFDAIWVIMASYAGMAALFFKLRHPTVPLFLTLQEGDTEAHILSKVNIFYPLWRLLFKKADYIQAISNYLADFARRHGAKCPIEVVPNGISPEAFSGERLASNKKSETPNVRPYTLITTSRLVHKNGIDTLIRACAQLSSASWRTNYKLQILGSGPDEKKLKKLANDLSVGDKIQFLGHIEPDKIPEYLSRADIFVRASRSEGLGNSFLEAMAAGLPIIGTNVGGIRDFLIDGETGLFSKVGDPADLSDKILLLMKNEELRKKLSQNGRKLVIEKYSWDLIAGKMNKIFNKLCAS